MNDLQRNHQLQGLDKKTKGASRKACANFNSMYQLYRTQRGKWDISQTLLAEQNQHVAQKHDAQALDNFFPQPVPVELWRHLSYRLARGALFLGARFATLSRFLPGPERVRAECTR